MVAPTYLYSPVGPPTRCAYYYVWSPTTSTSVAPHKRVWHVPSVLTPTTTTTTSTVEECRGPRGTTYECLWTVGKATAGRLAAA